VISEKAKQRFRQRLQNIEDADEILNSVGDVTDQIQEALVDYDTSLVVDSKIENHSQNLNNPHSVTKSQVGLSNVDNTSDINKPISILTQEALDTKRNVSDFYIQKLSSNFTTTLDTLQDTPFVLPMEANETWIFAFRLQNGCNGSGGLKYAIDYPSGATLRCRFLGTGSGNAALVTQIVASTAEVVINLNTVNSQGGVTDIDGTIENGSSPGVLRLRIRAITGGETVTIHSASSVRAHKIGS